MEQIVFPIPEICEYITHDTKVKILNTAERDDQGSKVADFFDRTEAMFNEMKWQKKLRGNFRQNSITKPFFYISTIKCYRATCIILGKQLYVTVEYHFIQQCCTYELYRCILLSI